MTTVLLVDDRKNFRRQVRQLLDVAGGFEVVGEAADGWAAGHIAEMLRPDLIVMDFNMPRMGGMEATRLILQQNPRARIVILTAHAEHAYVERAAQIGAAGFLVKHRPELIVAGLQRVASGDQVFPHATEGRAGDVETMPDRVAPQCVAKPPASA